MSNEKEQIRGMEFEDFIRWEGSINQRINEMENYLETIKQEGSSKELI